MNTNRQCNAQETPGLPGFRIFGVRLGGGLDRFSEFFNALKTGAYGSQLRIFNALKFGHQVGGNTMSPPK